VRENDKENEMKRERTRMQRTWCSAITSSGGDSGFAVAGVSAVAMCGFRITRTCNRRHVHIN
jgi:hypothetical protein